MKFRIFGFSKIFCFYHILSKIGDKIRVSEAVPQYMRTAAILDKDLDELIKNIKNSFLKHFESYSKEQSEKEQTNADKLVKSCESELRAKLRKTEPRIQFLELNVGAVRYYQEISFTSGLNRKLLKNVF